MMTFIVDHDCTGLRPPCSCDHLHVTVHPGDVDMVAVATVEDIERL